MSAHTHDELRDELAAYVLGALPDADAAQLERHLEGCESCRERLRWLAPALDLLPASVEQRRPPERLRESLMASVRTEAATEPAPVREPRPRGLGLRLPFSLRPALAIGAVALAIGVGVGVGVGGGDSGEPGATLSHVEPFGQQSIGGTLERQGELATLRLEGMPELRRDQVYEVWIERDGALEPSTLFVTDSERGATAAIPDSLDGAERVLVTAEPRGGSEQPTGAPLLEAPL